MALTCFDARCNDYFVWLAVLRHGERRDGLTFPWVMTQGKRLFQAKKNRLIIVSLFITPFILLSAF